MRSSTPACAHLYEHTRVKVAMAGWTMAQLSEEAAIPDSSRTTGRPAAVAGDVQPMAADVDQVAWRSEPSPMTHRADVLIERAQCQERDENADDRHGLIVDRGKVAGNLE